MKKEVIINIDKKQDYVCVSFEAENEKCSYPCIGTVGLTNAVNACVKKIKKNGDIPVVKNNAKIPKKAKHKTSIIIEELSDEHGKKTELDSNEFIWIQTKINETNYGTRVISRFNDDVVSDIKNAVKIIESHGGVPIIEDFITKQRALDIFAHNFLIYRKINRADTEIHITAWIYRDGTYYVCDDRHAQGIISDVWFGVSSATVPTTLNETLDALKKFFCSEGIREDNILVETIKEQQEMIDG